MRVKSIFSILLLLLLPMAMAGQVREYEVNDHGKRAIRTEGDVRISRPDLVKNRGPAAPVVRRVPD